MFYAYNFYVYLIPLLMQFFLVGMFRKRSKGYSDGLNRFLFVGIFINDSSYDRDIRQWFLFVGIFVNESRLSGYLSTIPPMIGIFVNDSSYEPDYLYRINIWQLVTSYSPLGEGYPHQWENGEAQIPFCFLSIHAVLMRAVPCVSSGLMHRMSVYLPRFLRVFVAERAPLRGPLSVRSNCRYPVLCVITHFIRYS